MAVPEFQTFMLPVLRFAAKGEARISDILEPIANDLKLTEQDQSQLLPSGRQTVLANRVHWAKSFLAKAGLVESTRRAYFRITERGRMMLAEQPARIDIKLLLRYPEFAEFYRASAAPPTPAPTEPARPDLPDTPDQQIRALVQQVDAALAQEILSRLQHASPSFFERTVLALLVAMGYGGSAEEAAKHLGRTGDGGLDGVIDQDSLGLEQVYVQAKRYGTVNTIGPDAIRAFFGSLDAARATKGVFVTTSRFSKSAQEAASKMSRRMILIDGDYLARLMIRHNVAVRVDQKIELKKIDEDFFIE